jgi:pyruvate-ferredoxin/flavodoxin oxidoreductase
MLAHSNPEAARRLLDEAQEDVRARWRFYEHLAGLPVNETVSSTASEGDHD